MKIAILGGTGDIGQGLALRWALDTSHRIRIGSRSAERASRSAAEYRAALAGRGVDAPIEGDDNGVVTEGADVVVLATPPEYVSNTAETVSGALGDDAILVSPAVKLTRDDGGLHYDTPPAGSYCQQIVKQVAPENPVVGAFHNLPAKRLADLDAPLGMDTLVIGEDKAAKRMVIDLANEIEGLRGLDAGPLVNAATVEAVTPLCINVAINNEGLHDLGIRFV